MTYRSSHLYNLENLRPNSRGNWVHRRFATAYLRYDMGLSILLCRPTVPTISFYLHGALSCQLTIATRANRKLCFHYTWLDVLMLAVCILLMER